MRALAANRVAAEPDLKHLTAGCQLSTPLATGPWCSRMAVPLGQETGHLPVAMRDVICKARTSWLKNSEVLDILLNFKRYRFPVGKEAPDCPPGGTQDL